MLRRIAILTLLVLVSALLAYAQGTKPFGGRVFDAQNQQGIANLEVKLRPPSNSSTAILIGTTDRNGLFRFPQVHAGAYLVEVSQGPYLLYGGEINTSNSDTIQIPIQRR
jgi:hypothetical protein